MVVSGNQLLKRALSVVIILQMVMAPIARADDSTKTSILADATPPVPDKNSEAVYDGLYQNLLGSSKTNPLDYWSLLRQDFVDTNAKEIKSASPSSVMFKVLTGKFHPLKQFKASESLYDNFDGAVPEGSEKFQILIEGKLIHHFRVPIEALGVLGNYVVFIEKNSYNVQENFRHISFIDLDYFRLGKNELPIFRVPVHGVESISSFNIRNNVLYINDKPYEAGLFNFAAQMQRVLFNVAVNGTEPGHLMRVIQALEPFVEAFNANLAEVGKDSNDEAFKKNLQLNLKNQLDQLQKIKSSGDRLSEEQLKILSETFEKPLKEAMGKVHDNLQKQRTLIGSLSLVWQQMTIPRPAEVGKLKEKIVTIAVALKRDRTKISDMHELAKELATNKTVRYSLGTLAAAGVAYFFPDQSLYALKSTLEMVEYIGASAFGKVVDFADVSYKTATSTLSGFNPLNVYETYLADGAWKRTSVGVSAMFSILALVVGIPHILVNTYYLVKDFGKSPSLTWRSAEGKTGIMEFTRRLVPNFIRRQKEMRQEYLNALSDEKKKNIKEEQVLSSEELSSMAREFVMKMESQYNKDQVLTEFSLKTKLWGAISLFTEVNLPTAVSGAKWVGTQWKKFKNVENFAGALSHFIFSFAAFTKSGVFYATTWNYFYISRILALHPRMALTFMLYPNFFRRAVATELGQVTPPSFWNGGNRWVWQEVGVQLSRISHSEQYAALKNFENSIAPIEKQIGKEALTHSLEALTKYLNYDLDKVVKLSERPGMTKKLSTKDISKLSYDARTFFSSYYDILVENSLRRYLSLQAETETVQSPGLSREEIKKWFIDNKKQAMADLIDPKRIVETEATDENYKKAYALVHNSVNFLSKMSTANTHHTIRSLDSETNGKIRRFVIAEQQMKKASAMARAVRANIVSLLVDKPMELALLFVLTAGIQDGPNKPLFDQMFSDNSAFYLSRNVFMGYLAGLLISIFADVWVKIQQDTRVDKLGGFDQIPENEYAKKGFWSWYRYQFTHNKNNKWWDHHKYNSEIIYHNMGPAFILMTITGMATLGRVDLDFYFLGYFIAFFLPFTGLSLKFEQTFEIATGWVLRDVPLAIRNHPMILEWANKRITKLRIGFQIYYKLYENITGQLLSNLMAITTARNGTRALSRILFGGKTITEHIIEKTTSASGQFPGSRAVGQVCRLLFANNYSSGPLPPPPK